MSSHPLPDVTQYSVSIMDALPLPVAVLDGDGVIVWANQTWREVARGESGVDPVLEVGDSYVDGIGAYLSLEPQAAGALSSGIRALCDGDAADVLTGDDIVRAASVSGVEPRLVVVAHQVDPRRSIPTVSGQLYQEAFACIDEPLLIASSDGRIEYANSAYEHFSGYSVEATIGQSIEFMTVDEREPELRDAMLEALRIGRSWREELRIRRSDGDLRWASRTISPLCSDHGAITHLVLTVRDVTDQRQAIDDLKRRAYYDGLTMLPNRTLFLDRLRHAHIRVRRGNQPLAVMFLDLNGFKDVNDRFGHQTGDEVLCEIARRLVDCLRASDTVARSGGDEFVFLLEDVASDDDALTVARRVIDEISRPMAFDGTMVSVSGGIGIAFNSPSISDPEVLLRLADIALYHAKATDEHPFVIYRDHMTMPDSRTY